PAPRAAGAARASRAKTPAAPKPPPPPVKQPVKQQASDELSGLLKHLKSMKDKPTTRARLAKWIDTHFRQHGGAQPPKVVERALDDLVRLKFVTQDGTKVTYNLTS